MMVVTEQDISEHIGIIQEFCEEMESRVVPPSKSSTSKQIGTYFEKEFRKWCEEKLGITSDGSVAQGIDLPAFNLDVKTTSIAQPQSSSPFDGPGERITGVDYNILLFIYDKESVEGGSRFDVVSCVYIPKERTADYRKSAKARELVALYQEGDLTEEELREQLEDLTGIGAISEERFEEIIDNPPEVGTITITPAVQWRFNYNKMKDSPVPEGSTHIYSSRERRQRTLPE